MTPIKTFRADAAFLLELAAVTLVGWLSLISIPLLLGEIGISWDALNHHIYLGWTAEQTRFDQDLLAASYQAFQLPYLYWPVYKLASLNASGAVAGVVLASLHALVVPALWIIALACVPGKQWLDVTLRVLAVLLAFSSGVVLSMFDSTSNDLLAAIPLVWAVALALAPIGVNHDGLTRPSKAIGWSGLLAGMAVALKLSNGPLAIVMPTVWVFAGSNSRQRLNMLLLGCGAAVLGFILTYGYWGWQLWLYVGNPVYPFADPYFEPLRRWSGWQP